MTHRGTSDCKVCYGFEYLRSTINYLLGDADWSAIRWRQDCTWGTPHLLVSACLLWAWGDQTRISDCFETARKIALTAFPQSQAVAHSYQAFTKLLKRWSAQLCWLLSQELHKRMVDEFSEVMTVGSYTIMAIDGSRIGLPRTKSNENEFSCKRHKKKRKGKKHRRRSDEKKANATTMWITTLWNCGTGLPWMWRRGPGDSSERAHWMEMVAEAPADTLFVADAGYVGFEYLQRVILTGREFVLRVGANVRLITGLGYAREREGIVYLWPSKEARKKLPPLVLRLVVSHNGKHPVYLLTSVTSQRKLSDAQVISAYRKRWGVELFYRHLKQTFGKRKLKSTSAEVAYLEMDWAFLGLWCMAMYAVKQLDGQAISPTRLSFAKLIRAFQRTMRNYLVDQPLSLCAMLLDALIDEYERGDKTSRDYPRKKNDRHRPSKPIIQQATPQQIARAQELLAATLPELRLTA